MPSDLEVARRAEHSEAETHTPVKVAEEAALHSAALKVTMLKRERRRPPPERVGSAALVVDGFEKEVRAVEFLAFHHLEW